MNIVRQKGTKDIFGDDILVWQFAEDKIRRVTKKFNVKEIRTPVFEATELYSRSVGDETDIVNKEMYTFEDRGGRSITLRPELTAGVVRAYIENGFSSLTQPVKLWYQANMYRYEKMQKGRYREFNQFGTEIFGSNSYLADIESIQISYNFLKEIGINEMISLSINSIGCKSCRQNYLKVLKDYLAPHIASMCDTCKARYNKNIMRIIDCKEDSCKKIVEEAPMITDYLCDECREDFENLKNGLDSIKIPYEIDKKIVRGLDYYNKTVYEYTSKDLGLAIGGGGRYDLLVEELDGPSTPAVGFAFGMDRIVLLLKEYGANDKIVNNVDIYFVTMESGGYNAIHEIVSGVRDYGYVVETDISNRSMKAQMKYANNINSRYVCIIGENELSTNTCVIKNMESGNQVEVELSVNKILEIMN